MIDVKVGNYIKDTLDYDKTLIILGRENFVQNDYTTSYIYFDTIAPAQIVSKTENFNGDDELISYTTQYTQNYTIDFVGNNALTNVNDFVNLQGSQRASNSRYTNEITVFVSNNITNLKDQVGNQYYVRYQLDVIVEYNITTTITELPFESANIEITIDE